MRLLLQSSVVALMIVGGPERVAAPVLNEFVLSGGGLACITATPPSSADYGSCLRIGKVVIGGEFAPVVERFGAPDATQPVDEGNAQAQIYVFDGRPASTTYISVWESRGEIIAVQLTGTNAKDLGFSGVLLGASPESVRARLGPPSKVWHDEAYDLWSYRPFPFSIEFRDSRVYSIKVWAAGKPGPCACGEPDCCHGRDSDQSRVE